MDIEKEKKAIARLKAFEPEIESYYLCYSGGKDSDCIRILAQLAGVRHEIHHNLTTVDAPETIQYIKSIPNVIIDRGYYSDGKPITMWNLIPKKKIPPTRLIRYCCETLKEHGGKGRMKITGVRWAESLNRRKNAGVIEIIGKAKTTQKYLAEQGAEFSVAPKGGIILNDDNHENRRFVEHCYRTTSTMINPIVDWSESDVWDFLHHYGCESNPLYKCQGKKRIGCIGCPMGSLSNRYREFETYPKYKENYIKAFDRMLKENEKSGLDSKYDWKNGKEVFKWWLEEDVNQLSFFDD